jgi:hypothetical protein
MALFLEDPLYVLSSHESEKLYDIVRGRSFNVLFRLEK